MFTLVARRGASRPFIAGRWRSGINFFDTANVYSDGTSEEIVGPRAHGLRRGATRS